MTAPLEALAQIYTERGHPNVGSVLKRAATVAKKVGMAEYLPGVTISIKVDETTPYDPMSDEHRKATSKTVNEELREFGISPYIANCVYRGMLYAHPDSPRHHALSDVASARDLSRVPDEDLRMIPDLTVRRIKKIRSVIPYQPPETEIYPGPSEV